MKISRFLILICLLSAIFTLNASAEAQTPEDFYAEQYKNSGAEEIEQSLPEKTREYLSEYGIDPSDYNWVNSLSAESVFGHIWGFVKSGAKAPLSAGAGITAIILVAAALGSMEIKSSAANTAVYASAVASAAVIVVPAVSVISASVDALKGTGVFMLSFVPIFAVIVAASGAAVTSVSMSALLLAASQAVSYISSFVIMPLMGGYLALSVCSSVSPMMKKSGIAETVKKLALWLMALITTVFISVLGLQTAVNASADTLASKTAKFIVGSSVPVAGGALSEALNVVTASMGILKSSVGIYAALACAATLLPFAAELVIWRAVMLVTSSVSEMLGLPQISGLLKAVDSAFSLLIGIILLVGAMFIISLAVVVSGVKTV